MDSGHGNMMEAESKPWNKYQNLILIGVAVFLSLGCWLTDPLDLDSRANAVVSVAVLMVSLWVMDALPMPVVAILPLVLFPLLGISSLEKTAGSYANPVIYLFFGGFMLGLAIEKWHLHRRIALHIIRATGTSGDRIVLGFILATGLISMWLSNTATTMMMYPIALSVISVIARNPQQNSNYPYFNLSIMLAIAYASNIGGIATIIGTPPNVAYIGYFRSKYQTDIDFMSWMALCLPISLLLLGSLYLVMVKWLYPSRIRADQSSSLYISQELDSLGRLTTPERRVLVIFILTAGMWIFRALINDAQTWFKLDDTIIALIGAILLFLVPSGSDTGKKTFRPLLEWEDTSRMAWGILLLFGGGISLAQALEDVGLISQLGSWLGNIRSSPVAMIFLISILSIFISEVMSNVAQVIVFAPVVSSVADNMGIDPLLLGIPMTLAASCAGMLPMGTPPNAIVFGSNHIKMKDMVRVGLVMNLIAVVVITMFVWLVKPMIFG